jgi:hypothetical protein
VPGLQLSFAPLVPTPLLIGLAVLAAIAVALVVFGGSRGRWLRAAAVALLLLALANPSLDRQDRERLSSVVALVVDKSASQNLDGRAAQTEAVRADIAAKLARLPGVEVRTIEAGANTDAADGTELFGALQTALSDVPPERVGGAILITDGVVHDIPETAEALGFRAPVHSLITGRPGERDRRVALLNTPRFGIVDQPQTIRFKVEDTGGTAPVAVTVRRDGETVARLEAVPGQAVSVPVQIGHVGRNIVEIDAAVLDGEITAVNNRAVLPIDGVREKLRVLLVSGEPHAGERTWRNLLKSDASVDLVHFTILRPPEKQDGTPINELSLIAFPTRELFAQKIDEFDLIIFDRYARQGILPLVYFDNIARYVRKGGAVLVAAGPDYAAVGSLYETPLAPVLPAEPVGGVVEQPFHPKLTEPGKRHPVTRALPGSGAEPPQWSRWFRIVETRQRSGDAVMSGPGDRPLLVLSREEKGRVALLLSDHAWLWARGFDGGGPHLDLLRRLSHWLMKEPDLEEEALRAVSRGAGLTVERQTLGDSVAPISITTPSGGRRTLTLTEAEPGLWRGTVPDAELGLHTITDGVFTTLAHVGPANPREYTEVVSTNEKLEPLARATGGSARRIADAERQVETPRIVAVRGSERLAGADWIGIRATEASLVRGLSIWPVFAGLLGLILLIGAFAATWAREGR